MSDALYWAGRGEAPESRWVERAMPELTGPGVAGDAPRDYDSILAEMESRGLEVVDG